MMDGERLIARSRLRSAWPILLVTASAGAVIGAVLGLAVALTDPELATTESKVDAVLISLTMFGLVCLPAALVPLAMWSVSAARVSYWVAGTRVVARRGRRIVAELDARDVASVRVIGYSSVWPMIFGLGTIWSFQTDLPRIGYETRAPVRGRTLHTLPRILLVGRDVPERIRDELFAALRLASVRESVLDPSTQ
ncbi:hypothetical protein [Aeromicrobium sp. IC_218]|uniref:hypothetical protein n=1 Tax=Aeromicrobium sp. IC_218 TaxID=2545468 RepID=UPI00103A9EAB|nr:hypothetical protein [Aeromicrobium sp. IC_218]TCI99465.1 hypothetical protein E0W78_06945 [Aeromicrobium sp. IC_218]